MNPPDKDKDIEECGYCQGKGTVTIGDCEEGVEETCTECDGYGFLDEDQRGDRI